MHWGGRQEMPYAGESAERRYDQTYHGEHELQASGEGMTRWMAASVRRRGATRRVAEGEGW